MHRRFLVAILFIALCLPGMRAGAQVRVTSLGDQIILIQTPRSNLVASVGPDGAALVGEVEKSSARAIADSLTARTSSPRRFVIATAGLASVDQGDAGWDSLGALVVMQEFAVRRMKSFTPPVRRPRSEFSDFFSLTLNGEPMHAVRQEPGYATSDVLVHFEKSNVIYLGESYSGDGYPRIDTSLGGTVEGMLKTLEPWAKQTGGSRFVGARGGVASSSDILSYRDMVKAVSDQVRALKSQGRTIDEVIAAKPTKPYDAKWGHGLVTAESFVRDLYQSGK